MKEVNLTTAIQIYDSIDELPQEVHELMQQAITAREKAYAPYSKFNVGAAILLENGISVQGSNQENASYPNGLCAERTAIFYAGANHPETKIKLIAVTARSLNQVLETPVPPCGACRQVIAEYQSRQTEPIAIFFMAEKGKVIKVNSINDLLPLSFDKSYL